MRRDACAGTVCLPRSKRCRILPREKKRKVSIDLNRRAASGPRHFRQARGNSARDIVQTLSTSALFAERRHGLPGVATDSNARINFNLAEHRHAISDRGLRALAVAK